MEPKAEFAEVEKRSRLVADAIILERAERVLARHRPETSAVRTVHEKHASAEHLLRMKARELRQEAETGV